MKSEDVTGLMTQFQRALVALAPIAEDAGISWRDGESYDEWDRIAQAMFYSFVVDVVKQDVSVSPFTEYDMRYSDYSSLTHIKVNIKDTTEFGVFVAYATQEEPFDSIKYVSCGTDSSIEPISKLVKASNVIFSLQKSKHGL